MKIPDRFPRNEIISLTDEACRYDLAESVGPDLTLQALFSGDKPDALANLAFSYGTAAGNATLRRLIAARHGVDTEDVIVTVGGMHALFLLAFILCEPGDDVVISTPLFPNTRTVLQSVRANLRLAPLDFEHGYRLDPGQVRAQLTPRTKLVSLTTPQNPSGVAIAPAAIEGLLRHMTEVCPDAVLMIDETYREAAYGTRPVQPSLIHLDPRIVSTSSLSKCHGSPGLRIGWAITRDRALREQLVLGKFNTVVSNSTVDEALAVRVLERGDEILADRRRQLQTGFELTAQLVRQHAHLIEWVAPDAGALCCIRLRRGIFDDAAVARFYALLRARDVRVAPGTWFAEEARVFRLGFGLLAIADFAEALKRLAAALEDAARRVA